MGKKNKKQKPIMKARANIKKLKELDNSYLEFRVKLDNIPSTNWLERRLLFEEQIELIEQTKDVYFCSEWV